MKLYTQNGSPLAQKVLVAAEFAGKSVNPVTDFNAKDIAGKAGADRLPLLETTEGCLFEATAIARYLCAGNKTLLGDSTFEQAQVNSWVDFSTNELETAAAFVTYPIIGWAPSVAGLHKKGMEDLMNALKVLDNYLKMETYLVGRNITLADIACAVALILPMKTVLGDAERKKVKNVTRWFNTIVNQKQVKAVVGPVTLPKKAMQGPKEEAPKAAPAAAPKAAPAAPKAETPADVLKALPKSDFVLDSWKRQYSNAPNHDYYLSMPWFWENLDKNGYSVWKSEYKYNEDLLTQPAFVTSNLAVDLFNVVMASVNTLSVL